MFAVLQLFETKNNNFKSLRAFQSNFLLKNNINHFT